MGEFFNRAKCLLVLIFWLVKAIFMKLFRVNKKSISENFKDIIIEHMTF